MLCSCTMFHSCGQYSISRHVSAIVYTEPTLKMVQVKGEVVFTYDRQTQKSHHFIYTYQCGAHKH